MTMNNIEYTKSLFVYNDRNLYGFLLFGKNRSSEDYALVEINVFTYSIKTINQLLQEIHNVRIGNKYQHEEQTQKIVLTIGPTETIVYDYLENIEVVMSTPEFTSILQAKKRFIEELKTINLQEVVSEALMIMKQNLNVNEYFFYGVRIKNGLQIIFAMDKTDIEQLKLEEFLPTLRINEKIFEE